MDKKIFNSILIVAFTLLGVNAAFCNDKFHVQSLNVDNSMEMEESSSINMKTEYFQQEKEEETTIQQTPIIVQPIIYPNNYVQYKKVIGPYYTTRTYPMKPLNYKGFGYNYTGHGYNYGYSTTNNNPIFVSPPPPPPTSIKPQIPNHGGGTFPHQRPIHPHFKY